ncbi:MAG: hypothetical protein M0Q43_12505 [Methanothrix sp.]|jgi:hypothetical protein|nr:hypothetical protein [Methanothrix sp.]
MSRKFCDLKASDLAKLPGLSYDHFFIGDEIICMHLINKKNMHWYLAEYGPIGKNFFGFFENKTDGLASGQCSIEEILYWAKKGDAWEPMVDEDWKPMKARDIPILTEYVKLMICQPDLA